MSGTFAEWQPRYAERGIPTFPVKNKRPAVRGYLKLGPVRSRDLARRFSAHEAFGFALGEPSKITVLDVDTPDERVLADALLSHGQTPIVVRSGSGNYQAWYRHNGERRHVRPWQDYPIDILGRGYVVAPPSAGTRNCYAFIQGSLDDVAALPVLGGLDAAAGLTARSDRAICEGRRNEGLWRHCMRQARYCDSFDDLLDVARTFNEHSCARPLEDEEVIKIARSAWGYTERGENWFGTRGVWFSADEANSLIRTDQDCYLLLSFLQANNGPNSCFMIANGLAKVLGWGEKRLAAARRRLHKSHVQRLRGPSSQTGAAIYTWRNTKTGQI
jgi:Bifunctional DNA primase/polymerase, N-terminal/Primase C terminal 1 (PriCT-1)